MCTHMRHDNTEPTRMTVCVRLSRMSRRFIPSLLWCTLVGILVLDMLDIRTRLG